MITNLTSKQNSTKLVPTEEGLNLYKYHSYELKYRLLYIFFTWLFSFGVVFFNMEFLLYKISFAELTNTKTHLLYQQQSLLETTASSQGFIFTEIFEAFFSYIVFTSYLAFLITLPCFYYHLYKFLLPGLAFSEAKLFKLFFSLSLFLISLAHILTYFLIVPYALSFFLNFQSGLGTNIWINQTEIFGQGQLSESSVGSLGLNSVQTAVDEKKAFHIDYNPQSGVPNITFLGRLYPWILFLINFFTGISFLFQLPLFLFVFFLSLTKLTSISKTQIVKTHKVGFFNTKFLTSYSKYDDSTNVKDMESEQFESTNGKARSLKLKVSLRNFNTTFTRKLLFFALVLLTAIFSPPDLYSQFFLFLPLFLIIEFFLFSVFLYLEYITYIRV